MQVATLGEIFAHPGFICIFLSILITVANILIGVSILPEDKRKRSYRLHRVVYLAVVASYITFLWVTHSLAGNGWLNYVVLIYFIFVIPMTRKINVTTHAVLSSFGLVLLVGVGAFGVF